MIHFTLSGGNSHLGQTGRVAPGMVDEPKIHYNVVLFTHTGKTRRHPIRIPSTESGLTSKTYRNKYFV
jgi:hypothetical protein